MNPRLLSSYLSLLLAGATLAGAQSQPQVHSLTVDGRVVVYQIQDGQAITHGDIILGPADEIEAVARGEQEAVSRFKSRSLVMTLSAQLWPQATLYYTIDPDIPNPSRLQAAIDHWNANTPIKMIQRSGQPNYVRFKRTTGDFACASSIGMVGGEQLIQTTDGCTTGSAIHELGHALGLYHEQERSDRNAYVTILYSGIDKRFYSDFDQIASAQDASFYDYGSIMHYAAAGFARNGQDSIETVPPGIPIGQRDGLSAGDIDAISRLYGLTPKTTTITTVPTGLTIIVDGQQATSPQTFSWSFGARHTIEVPDTQGTDPRHVFVRWTDGGTAAHSITASQDQTVIAAVFQRQHQFSIKVANGRGAASATPTSDTGYFPERLPVKVTASPDSGSRFQNWSGTTNLQASGAGISSQSAVIEVTLPDTSYQANFTTQQFVTINSVPLGALITVDNTTYRTPVNLTWAAGSQHTLTVADNQMSGNNTSRLKFLKWDDESNGLTRHVTAAGGNYIYFAQFQQQYLFTALTAGSGTIRVTPPSDDNFYDEGTQLQVRGVPTAGSVVRYWQFDTLGFGDTKTVTMDQQRVAAAIFAPTTLTFRPLSAASWMGNPLFENPGTSVAPLEIVALVGSGLGPSDLAPGVVDSTGKVGTSVAGTRILFDGVPAPILYAWDKQTAVVVPASVAGKTSTLVAVEKNGVVQPGSVSVSVANTLPGLFTADQSGAGNVAAFNENGTVNSPSNPASAGSIVVLYATGAGLMDRSLPDGAPAPGGLSPKAPVFVRFGKLPGEIIYAGSAPGLVNGAIQINVRLPKELIGGDVPVQVNFGEYASPPGTTIAVQ